MDHMPWQALVFQSIPESIIFISLGLGLLGIYPHFRYVAGIGIISALFSFLIRRLPLQFGLHSLIHLMFLSVLLKIALKKEWWRLIAASLLGGAILGLLEIISIPLLLRLTGMNLTDIVSNPWLRVLFPLPNEIILGIIAYLIWRRRISLVRIERAAHPRGDCGEQG